MRLPRPLLGQQHNLDWFRPKSPVLWRRFSGSTGSQMHISHGTFRRNYQIEFALRFASLIGYTRILQSGCQAKCRPRVEEKILAKQPIRGFEFHRQARKLRQSHNFVTWTTASASKPLQGKKSRQSRESSCREFSSWRALAANATSAIKLPHGKCPP